MDTNFLHLLFGCIAKRSVDIQSIIDLTELERRYQLCPGLLKGQIARRYKDLLQSVIDLTELEKRYLSCPELLRGLVSARYRELLVFVTDIAELEGRYRSCPGPLKYEILGKVANLNRVS